MKRLVHVILNSRSDKLTHHKFYNKTHGEIGNMIIGELHILEVNIILKRNVVL